MPKFKKWKIQEPSVDIKSQHRIEDTRRASQTFVCLATIATGILTIIAFTHNRQIWSRYPGWVRTLRSNIPTVAVVKETLAQDFHGYIEYFSVPPTFAFIRSLRRCNEFLFYDVT